MYEQFWQTLRIGDRVQVCRLPAELENERLDAETTRIYEWIIKNKTVLTIGEIDRDGIPIGSFVYLREVEVYESLRLNHSCFRIVGGNLSEET